MEYKRLLTKNEAANILGVSRQTVQNWLDADLIGGRYINNTLYIDHKTLDCLFDKLRSIDERKRKLDAAIKVVESDIIEWQQKHDEWIENLKLFSSYSPYSYHTINAKINFLQRFVTSVCKMKHFHNQTEHIVNLLIAGLSPDCIAEETGCTRTNVLSIANGFWITLFDKGVLDEICKNIDIISKNNEL